LRERISGHVNPLFSNDAAVVIDHVVGDDVAMDVSPAVGQMVCDDATVVIDHVSGDDAVDDFDGKSKPPTMVKDKIIFLY